MLFRRLYVYCYLTRLSNTSYIFYCQFDPRFQWAEGYSSLYLH